MLEHVRGEALPEITMSGTSYGFIQAQKAEVIHGLVARDIAARENGPTKEEAQLLEFFNRLINAHGGGR